MNETPRNTCPQPEIKVVSPLWKGVVIEDNLVIFILCVRRLLCHRPGGFGCLWSRSEIRIHRLKTSGKRCSHCDIMPLFRVYYTDMFLDNSSQLQFDGIARLNRAYDRWFIFALNNLDPPFDNKSSVFFGDLIAGGCWHIIYG